MAIGITRWSLNRGGPRDQVISEQGLSCRVVGTRTDERMFIGPAIDDPEILGMLPPDYRQLLETANGYVAYHGGLGLTP